MLPQVAPSIESPLHLKALKKGSLYSVDTSIRHFNSYQGLQKIARCMGSVQEPSKSNVMFNQIKQMRTINLEAAPLQAQKSISAAIVGQGRSSTTLSNPKMLRKKTSVGILTNPSN